MFTQVTVTGTVTLSNATPAHNAVVRFQLSKTISDGTQVVVPQQLDAVCNSSGIFTITLNANDDTTTTPTGSYYLVEITDGGQMLEQFGVTLAHANTSVNLFALAQIPIPTTTGTVPAGVVGLSQGSNMGISIVDSGSGPDTVILPNLPTSNPQRAGQLWNNNGVLSVSAGIA